MTIILKVHKWIAHNKRAKVMYVLSSRRWYLKVLELNDIIKVIIYMFKSEKFT